MIDGKTTSRAGNDNKGRKSVGFDDIRNLFSRHKRESNRGTQNSKHINLLLFVCSKFNPKGIYPV
jgi:hypothetical protein